MSNTEVYMKEAEKVINLTGLAKIYAWTDLWVRFRQDKTLTKTEQDMLIIYLSSIL